jgi:sigma-B regulation protein RsbU (phosphoserine phosphatase)
MNDMTDDLARRDASVDHYDLAPCGYLTVAYDGPVLRVNETFLHWTGYQRDELVGTRSFGDIVTKAGQIYGQTHLRPMLLAHGRVREIALDIVRTDGSRLPVLLNATLERGAGGRPDVVHVAVFDVSERRAYEIELLRAKERAEASEEHTRLLSQTLQETLIPPVAPVVAGLDVAAVYRPAGNGTEIGGDFYDIFKIADGEWVVALGDVCGKGVDAAVVTALVRHTLRAATVDHPSPAVALERLNQVVKEHGADRFCTVVLLRLQQDAGGWDVTFCSGGHPLPVLLRSGQEPTSIGRHSPLVGVLDELDFDDHTVRLGPEDTLVLYTDGVTEARRDGEFYGEDRLCEVLAVEATDATTRVDTLLDEVLEFQRGRTRDDIAIVAVRVPRVASA